MHAERSAALEYIAPAGRHRGGETLGVADRVHLHLVGEPDGAVDGELEVERLRPVDVEAR